MEQFTKKEEIPEILLYGLRAYMDMLGRSPQQNQKMYPTAVWNKFKKDLGALPEEKSGTDFILDTEFTDLKDGKAISIALVEKKYPHRKFYIELSDTYTINDCSDFVKKEVLPHLKGDIFKADTETAAGLLNIYLNLFPRPWNMWSDCPPLDNKILNTIIDENDYVSCSLRDMDYLSALCYVEYSRRHPKFKDLNAHNALDDAFRFAVAYKDLEDALSTLDNTPGITA